MRCLFCGVGEAFDSDRPNTSIHLHGPGQSLLLDCGFTAAAAFFRFAPDPLGLAAVYISHFHGDHFLGLPWLAVRFLEEGRSAPLTVVGQPGVADKVWACLDLAYPSFRGRATFSLNFQEAEPGREIFAGGFGLRFARGEHSTPCLAVRAEAEGAAIFYSGDGRPTPATRDLAQGADLVIQEAYVLAPGHPGHGSVDEALVLAREAGAPRLALVHLSRTLGVKERAALSARLAAEPGMRAWLPEPGEILELEKDIQNNGAFPPETPEDGK